jgi:hypothetical protein
MGVQVALVPGHDDVRDAPRRRHKLVLRGLDEARVLRDDAAQVAAPVLDVAQDAPREAQVVVGVYVDLQAQSDRRPPNRTVHLTELP